MRRVNIAPDAGISGPGGNETGTAKAELSDGVLRASESAPAQPLG